MIGGRVLALTVVLAVWVAPAAAQSAARPPARSGGYQPGVEPQIEQRSAPWVEGSPSYEWQNPYYGGAGDYGPGDWRRGQPASPDDWPYGGEWRRQWDRAHAPVYSGAYGLYGGEYYVNGNGPAYFYGLLDRDSFTYEGPVERARYNAADYYFAEATRAFGFGEYRLALKWATHAEVEEPWQPQIHLLEMLSLLATSDYPAAAVQARALAAFQELPTWNQVYQYYGDVRPYTHQFRALEGYIRAHGKDPDARVVLGVLYMMGGYQNAAGREFLAAHRLMPSDREVTRLLIRDAPEIAARLQFYEARSAEQPEPNQPSLGYLPAGRGPHFENSSTEQPPPAPVPPRAQPPALESPPPPPPTPVPPRSESPPH
jgi:hypothetical protein